MNYLKKTVALLLVAVMVLGLVACGEETNPDTEVKKSPLYQETTRVLNIGSWYESYYTSAHSDIYDNPNVDNIENAEKSLQNMRSIEQRYNIQLYYRNMLWEGVITSINTSIMANSPDADVYMVDLQFGIPAVLNNYAYSLEYILKESPEASKIEEKYLDIFSEEGSDVIKTLQITSDGLTYLFAANSIELGGYALGYNKNLIDQNGLEDPYELYMDNEWTWDTWLNQMITITQDLDNDGTTDQWGFRGSWINLVNQLLMSNNASIAALEADESGYIKEQLTSTATTETLNFLYDMYQTYKVSFWDATCDDDWNDNVYAWAEGNIGFWNSAAWITSEADPDQDLFDIMGMVNWPVGPSGDYSTNPSINSTAGTYYIIPVGIENPALVYCVMYDFFNWYDGDLSLRDDTQWFEDWCYTEENFNMLVSMGDETRDFTLDMWQQVSFDESYMLRGVIETSADAVPITVAEFQQANKQIVQDYLDTNFNK